MVSTFQILRSVLALLVVLWLANAALKYLNKHSSPKMQSIQIIERMAVSKTSSLAIVKIVDDYYLMNFSETGSETLQKFSPKEAEEIESRQREGKESSAQLELAELKKHYTKLFNRSN